MAKLHWQEVETLAKAHHLEKATSNLEALSRSLQWWWCQKYNRPLKDPILQQYTLDELLYEFLRHFYLDPENDPKKKVEESVLQKEDDDWIQKQLTQISKMNLKPLADGVKAISEALEKQAAPPPEEPTEPAVQVPDLPNISTKFDE